MALVKNAVGVPSSLLERAASRNVQRAAQAHVPSSRKFGVAGRLHKSSGQRQSRRCAPVCSIGEENRTKVIVRAHDGHASQPTPAEVAQTIVELSEEAILVTINNSEDTPYPLSTHVYYALDADGQPIVRLKEGGLAAASAGGRACLHVQVELPGGQKPQCALHGRLYRDDKTVSDASAAWKRRYEGIIGEGEGFVLYQLDVQRALVSGDSDADTEWIAAEEYLAAEPDPLREVAAGIVDDFNVENYQDLRRFPYAFGGLTDLEVEDVSMTWVDRLGFDLSVAAKSSIEDDGPAKLLEIRIPFEREVADEREARSALTMMAQVAWEAERNYTSEPTITADA